MHKRNHVLLLAIAAAIGLSVSAEIAVAGKSGFVWGVARALSSIGRDVGLTVAVTGVDEPSTTLAVDIQPVKVPYEVTVHPQLGHDGATYFVSKDGKLTASYGETTVALEPQPTGGFLAAVWVSGELVSEPIPLP